MSKELPYDPVLKTAMLEIQEILDKHDIGGSVILTSQSHSEFLYHLPNWCIVQFDKKKPGHVRIKSKKKDFKDRKQQHLMAEFSTHVIAQNRDLSAQSFDIFDRLFKELEKYFDIDHQPFKGFAPHFIN